MKHHMCRPPDGAKEVEALAADGTWMPDDGKPALSFSGKLGTWPVAWAVDCNCGLTGRGCPMRLAMDRTVERYHCANGQTVPPSDQRVVKRMERERLRASVVRLRRELSGAIKDMEAAQRVSSLAQERLEAEVAKLEALK